MSKRHEIRQISYRPSIKSMNFAIARSHALCSTCPTFSLIRIKKKCQKEVGIPIFWNVLDFQNRKSAILDIFSVS